MRKIILQLKRILWDDSFDAVELFGAVNAFLWSIWFSTHPTLFSQGMVYKTLATFGSIHVWAIAFGVLGALKLYGVLSDTYFARKWISLLATFLWAFIFITFIQGNPLSLLLPITGEILAYSIWEFLRHSRRQKIRKEIRREVKIGILK